MTDDRKAIAKRRDDALRVALNTSPKPHKDMKKGGKQKRDERPNASDTLTARK
jgi:hypothetical protein